MGAVTIAALRTERALAEAGRSRDDVEVSVRAFTDSAGRVLAVNRAFGRLAQLSSEEQARGESLDRWLGRSGAELPVLLANLREGGNAGLFTTELRGAQGLDFGGKSEGGTIPKIIARSDIVWCDSSCIGVEY